MIHRLGLLLVILFTAGNIHAQISIVVQGGLTSSLDGKDAYALNTQWQPTGNSNQSSITFLSGASGTAGSAMIMWEASPTISVGFIYSSYSFTADVARTATSKNMGVVFKVNFVKNTNKVIPYFMAGYTFSNNYSITQSQATSTAYPAQVQPAFTVTGSGNVGFLAEFGAEVRLTNSLYFIANVGGRGIDIGGSLGKPPIPSYGSAYAQPTDFDGSFFLSYNAGLKYYFGKGKKKRDF